MFVGPTELDLRGNQEFLTLILNPNTAVFLDCVRRVRNSGPTLGFIFWVRVRVRVYNGL